MTDERLQGGLVPYLESEGSDSLQERSVTPEQTNEEGLPFVLKSLGGLKKCVENFSDSDGYSPFQFAWTTEGANAFLAKSQLGREAVHEFNRFDWVVKKVERCGQKKIYSNIVVEDEDYGGANRDTKTIVISNTMNDDGEAATTLVHEVTHLQQNEANENSLEQPPYPDTFAMEFQAHRRQEEFKEEAGLEMDEDFLTDGMLDNEKISVYVRDRYDINEDTSVVPDEEGEEDGLADTCEEEDFEEEPFEIIEQWPEPWLPEI